TTAALSALSAVAAFLAVPAVVLPTAAQAQQQQPDEEAAAAAKKKRDSEWNQPRAPLPQLRNAGPCPFVKVLYDAGRYIEFKDNREASSAVAYTGELQGLSSGCEYKDADPIKVRLEMLFGLGRGPEATESHKTYRYWVAVTQRNKQVLAKEYF